MAIALQTTSREASTDREGTFLKRKRGIATILTLGLLGANILVLSGTAEAAKPKCMGKTATKVGTNGVDEINGTKRADVIVAKGGDDSVFGRGGNDLICGGSGVDFLFGGGGNDKIDGGSAEDFLLGQLGNDTFKGGVDPDMVLFVGASGPVDVDMAAGTATGEGSDKLVSGINSIFGSAFDDTLKGNKATNFLFGNDGNDTIEGLGNIDLITPGDGNDIVDGGETPGSGSGFDLDIVYFTGTSGVVVNLQTGTATGGQGTDDLANLEAVVGSEVDDDITGDNGSNILFGDLGDDTIDGGGGQGIDYASYWFATQAVDANLETGVATGEGTDELVRIDGLLGTIDFNDELTGDGENNYLDGDGGNDTLNGGDGEDLFLGGLGDDTMNGGPGTFDMVDYFCVCDLDANLLTGVIEGDGTDAVSGMEAVGAADGNDTLKGDGNDNIFFGWGGTDTIEGMGGNDKLDGGAGTNTLDGGPGTADQCVNYTSYANCEDLSGTIADHPLRLDTELVSALRRNF